MNPTELLSRLRDAGITLAVHGDKLRVRAPEGALTDELRQALGQHKQALLQLLAEPREASSAPPLTPVARDAPLALSFAQQRIWFLDRLLPDSTAYALISAFELRGELDVPALRHGLDDLVARHEILRTTFGESAGVPWQKIAAPGSLDLPVEDLAAVPAAQRRDEASRRAGELGQQPFDLERGPLLRARLLRFDAGHHVLVLALHHITYDGWSLGVLYRDLATAYAARRAGAAPDWAPPALQYVDYAAWQRAWLDGPVLEGLLDHWRARLAQLPQLELPTDRPRPPVQTLVGRRLKLHLPQRLADELTELGRRRGATLFMSLAAGFCAVLQRYTGQEDVVLGSPVANRGRTELETLVGPFLNMLVLRADLSGAPSFLELLERVRDTTVDALTHQELPFEKLVEALQPERDRSRNPLFQVSFALQSGDLGGPALDGVTLAPVPVPRETTVFDLAVDVFERDDGLDVQFMYSSDLFEAQTIERMGAAYQALLEAVVAQPERPVGELSLMAPPARQRWLDALDDAAAPFPQDASVQDLIAARAQATPDALALVFEQTSLTYAELEAEANRIAHALRTRGVRRGTLVGLCLERGPGMVAGMLGTLKAGGAYVPLDPGFPRERLAFMLADCQAPVLLTQTGLIDDLDPLPASVLRLDADAAEIAAAPSTTPADGAGPDDLAYVIYTSGSTGRPKGVQVAHRAVVNFLTSMAREPGLGADDVLTAVTTISFDIAGLELFLPLTVGARVVLASRAVASDGQRLQALLRESGTTVLQATPATWTMLLQTGWSDPALKMICGGEALPRPLAQRLLAAGGELWNVYGPTETTIWSCVTRVEPGSGPVSIGRPIANTQVLVLDERREPLPAGVPGELYIGGAGLALGYLARPELDAERFVPDPFHPGERLYRTGDRVRQRADGTLLFLGRMDTQVKLRGFRIELGEIEAILGAHPEVREAAVLLRHDEASDPRLVAYASPRDPAAGLPLDALRAWLLARLPEYMVPAVFVGLDELPHTPNRKIDRQALPAPTGERRSALALVPPRTELERALAELWVALLPVDEVGVHDDFFALGGHSLLVTQLTSRVRDRLGLEMPLSRAFETPTIEGQARWIEQTREAGGEDGTPLLAPVPRGADLPVSFAQQRLWFLDQMGTGAAYNMPLALRLAGRLDQRALAASLDAVAARHEALRTGFRLVDGRPCQVIEPTVQIPVSRIDLGDVPAAQREAELARVAAEEADRPFDLAQAPLLRAVLVHLGEGEQDGEREHVLLLTVHHIVSDGWSLGILARELVEHYQAAVEQRAPDLPDLPVQYADFAVWQREHLDAQTMAGHLAYWTRQLGTDLTALQLPTDRPHPATQSFRGGSHRFHLPEPLTAALEDLARAEGVTLAMLLLGGVGALLSRCSGQEDIALGSPIANRTRSELEPLIGFFANSLVLRMDLSGDPSFRELVRRVQRMSLEAYEHQDLPFERLVDELSPERSLSRNPLFQVAFAMQEPPPPERALDGLTISHVPTAVTRTRTDLELHLRRAPGGLKGIMVFSTDLFDASTIERLAGYYASLLAGIVADPGCRLSDLPLLSAAERERQLLTWNHTGQPFEQDACIHQLIERRAHEAPDALALIHAQERVTYGALNARANRVAHVLRGLGVVPDQLVGLCVERGTDMIAGLLGILKAGGAYVPMDPGYPRERLAFMVRDSGASVLVTNEPLLELLPEHGAQVLCLDRDADALAAASDQDPQLVTGPDDLAYAIYTSGSTGTPKCALLSHRGLCSLTEAQRRMFGVEPSSRVLQFSSFSFDAATFEIVMALPKGATLVLGDRHALLPGVDLLEFLTEHRVTIVTLTPTALGALPAAELPDLVTITVAGEACPPELVSRWAPGRRFFNLYGPTETTVWATAAELRPGDDVHIGRPIDNTEAYILDGHGQPVPVGVPGELHIGGVGLARGYHQRPELTAERFIPDPFSRRPGARLYRTGDRARFRPDGNIDYLGRIDHQVKLRGHRIELGEIEAALERHPAVRESLAMIREDSPGSRRIVAYVVDDPEVALEPSADDGQDGDWAADHVSHWQTLYDDTYAEAARAADGTFNVSGWNSSYTDQPIGPEPMREWVERTVEQVAQLKPRRLLEMGCGSGLLLFRLAPRCEAYVGTDFSEAATQAVGAHLPALGEGAGRVELLQRTAHDLHGVPDGSLDTVLLNSVAQYFPSADYLVTVIEEALRVLGPRGQVFVGDVRSLPLLSAFHTSVQLFRADDDAPLAPLKRQIHSQANLDQELVVDPAFFLALAERLPAIREVEVRPKPGRYDNELSRFRYDVVLHVGPADEQPEQAAADADAAAPWLDWQGEGFDLGVLRERLSADAPDQLGLTGVPNARTYADIAATEALERADGPRTVGALREAVAARVEAAAPIHPDDLTDLAQALGYEARTSWAAARTDGSFDVWLQRRGCTRPRPPFPGARRTHLSWTAYTNNPLRGRRLRELVPRLREHLGEHLPEYMVPAAVVALEAFPVTPNGKTDREALPAPGALRPELASDYVAPQTPKEQTLAQIWAKALDLAQVGVHDNFFALGGDSILSIQVVAAAAQAGLSLRARDLFEHQTVAELAQLAGDDGPPVAEQGPVTGPVPLTPIQRWFLEQEPVDLGHFNQAFHLQAERAVHPDALRAALSLLLAHHDALRLTWTPGPEGWTQHLPEPGDEVPLRVVDLSGQSAEQRARVRLAEAERAEVSLDPEAGALLAAVLFQEGGDSHPSLLLVAHHLAVDAVSWPILLQDLSAALEAGARGEAPRLPAKTSSFLAWSTALQAHARTPAVADQARAWLERPWPDSVDLPRDLPDPGGADPNTVASLHRLTVALDPEATRALLQDVPGVYHTRIDEALVSALARALCAWTGSDHLALDLEGHGREDVLQGVDVSRTVGWFTSLYPALLEPERGADPGTSLREVKRQLRALPDHGLAFGLARYLSDDAQLVRRLAALPRPRVAFNYMGQLGGGMQGEGSAFRFSEHPTGPMRSPRQRRMHWLEINGMVRDGALEMAFGYSEALHLEATIQHLADAFLRELRALIEHCRSPESQRQVSSDVDEFNWSQDDLDDLLTDLGE